MPYGVCSFIDPPVPTSLALNMADAIPSIPTTISVRPPSKYASKKGKEPGTGTDSAFTPPPLEWLYRTWAVTHSTLSMWRSAQNVRITYKPYVKPGEEKKTGDGAAAAAATSVAIDDLVEYEKKDAEPVGANIKTVEGIDRPDPAQPLGAAFDWRGKGWLKIASSHWEILGYGERPIHATAQEGAAAAAGEKDRVERWAVTWFAPTLFTKEGIDIYSDRMDGLSEETLSAVMAALKKLESAPKIVTLVEKQMAPVLIKTSPPPPRET